MREVFESYHSDHIIVGDYPNEENEVPLYLLSKDSTGSNLQPVHKVHCIHKVYQQLHKMMYE